MFELSSLVRRLSGMRLLSICLSGLWAAVAISVVFAYQPGGPFDPLVRAAIFGPLPIALAAVRWPPAGSSWRATAAVAWLALIASLLLVPLLGGVLETLRTSRQALFPSGEVAYAGLLALGMTCLYTAIGVVGARRPAVAPSRTTFIKALALAAGLMVIASATLGLPTLANELALRDRPAVTSRFGPTDITLALPSCEEAPQLGNSAVLGGDAKALIDGEDAADVLLTGSRTDATHESWSATRTGRFGAGTATYQRSGDTATVVDAAGQRSLAPGDLHLGDPQGLTIDGPVAAAVNGRGPARVAEDRGIELIEQAHSRHCRIAIDGPLAESLSVLVRLIIDGTLTPGPVAVAWRGTLDWWVFADGELGQAEITIGGYPGDAWPSGGLQASIVARITATSRAGSMIMPPMSGSPTP